MAGEADAMLQALLAKTDTLPQAALRDLVSRGVILSVMTFEDHMNPKVHWIEPEEFGRAFEELTGGEKPMQTDEARAREVADIVLVGQDRIRPDGYQLHGLFYSFADAARHVAKDAALTPEQEAALIEGWCGSSDRYESAEVGVWWVATRQPIRSPDAILALSDSLAPEGGERKPH